MNYCEIKHCDIADGEGVRTSLFVAGCRRHCKDCFNASTWPFDAGEPFTDKIAEEVLGSLEPAYVDGLTVLGGEPMEPENQRALVGFLEEVRCRFPGKSIWLYTGDTYEDIVDGSKTTEVTDRMLACLDVMVDGAFVAELKDITLRFRGSSNQRIIDVPATRAAGEVVLWEDDPVHSTHSM